jgi:ribonuclease T2
VNKVKSIEGNLTAEWANLEEGKTGASFWAHEWDKHGTCSSQNPNLVGELNFFSQTLGLFEQWPIQEWLAASGIKPDDSAVLTEARVLSAISPHISSKIELHCEHVKGSEVPYLDSISICVDKSSLEPIDCPTPKDTCKQGLIYPTKN